MSESLIVGKSFSFALEIVQVYKYLIEVKKEYVMSKQLLRSGTSIGANVNEAISSQSKKDFVYKLGIALKEARETAYWLRLLSTSKYLDDLAYHKTLTNCNELIKILSSIILTTQQRYLQKKVIDS